MSILLSGEKNPRDFTDEELAEEWANVQELEEQLKLPLSAIRDEVLHRMDDEGLDYIITSKYVIKRQRRGNFNKVHLDWARENGAVKVTEQLDVGRLKQLRSAGVTIPGYMEVEFIRVTAKE